METDEEVDFILKRGELKQTGNNQTPETVFHWGIQTPKRGVWIANQTLSGVFDISSQSRQRLRNKQRNKIVKIYAD